MARFTTLYSGSSGNSALVEENGRYLLVDMGKSCRMTQNALKGLGLPLADLGGILVTHEHSDVYKRQKPGRGRAERPLFFACRAGGASMGKERSA